MHHHAMETECFQELWNKDGKLVLRHVYREGKRAVDFLASMRYDNPFGGSDNKSLFQFLSRVKLKPHKIG
ncbi:hypothetical protein LINPERHAP1_LOCUS41236 [Linum perenne]